MSEKKIVKGITDKRVERVHTAVESSLKAYGDGTKVFLELYTANGVVSTSTDAEFTAVHKALYKALGYTKDDTPNEYSAIKRMATYAKQKVKPPKAKATTAANNEGNREVIHTAAEVQESAVEQAESVEAIIANALSLIKRVRKSEAKEVKQAFVAAYKAVYKESLTITVNK